MPSTRYTVLLGLIVISLGACSADPGTGPLEPKWDRTICERCRMVLSDRSFAAEVRLSQPGKRSRIYTFDDIGCAVIWLQDKPWNDPQTTEIWVKDFHNGAWIDARLATYVKGRHSPMAYGLGARSTLVADGLSFEQAKAHILDVEQRFNRHGTHLQGQQDARSSAPKL